MCYKHSSPLISHAGDAFDSVLLGVPRVTLIENFASNAVVQKLVDVKPDRTSPEIL